jgi:hypothetical protein
VMGQRGEVHDVTDRRRPGHRVSKRGTQAAQVEPPYTLAARTLAVAERVVQVEPVDKTENAVDDGLRNEETPGVVTPGGPRDIPVGMTSPSMGSGCQQVKESLQMSTFRPRLGTLPLAGLG